MADHNQLLGKAGEDIAARYLLMKGMRQLESRFRTRSGEIDLIMQDDDTIVFVEVKTRSSLTYGMASEAVTIRKQASITRVAAQYLSNRGLDDSSVRFDVVEVYIVINRINHIRNAFYAQFG